MGESKRMIYINIALNIFEISLQFGGKRKYCRRSSQPNVQLFIILNKVEYPTDSIMNNSVKIKLISFW